MSNSAKNKGSNYERRIAQILSDYFGEEIRRTPGSGNLDIKGDLRSFNAEKLQGSLVGWTMELKKQERADIWRWIAQAKREAEEENNPHWALIFSRNRERDDYVCISLKEFMRLLKRKEGGLSESEEEIFL